MCAAKQSPADMTTLFSNCALRHCVVIITASCFLECDEWLHITICLPVCMRVCVSVCLPAFPPARPRKKNSYACSGQRQFSTVSFCGFGLWVRVRVLGSDNHNRFPNSNPNLNHNSNRNLILAPILTPNSS